MNLMLEHDRRFKMLKLALATFLLGTSWILSGEGSHAAQKDICLFPPCSKDTNTKSVYECEIKGWYGLGDDGKIEEYPLLPDNSPILAINKFSGVVIGERLSYVTKWTLIHKGSKESPIRPSSAGDVISPVVSPEEGL